MRALTLTALSAALCAALAGCSKRSAPPPTATADECVAYRNKMFSFLPAGEQQSAAALGMDKPSPLEMKLCQERMTSEEITCAVAAATQEAALACKPRVEIRPPEARRTPEECAPLREHVMKLAIENEAGLAVGPPFTPSMAAMFSRECERWMTKPRYDCVMKAPSPMGLMQCPP